jgi:type I restriction enzyme, S subunit
VGEEMKRYSSYKDSGVEWIGEIPIGWDLVRLKHLGDNRTEQIRTDDFVDLDVIHYSIPNVQEYGYGVIEEGSSIDSSKLKLYGGEVLLSKLNPRKSCVSIVEPNEKLIVGSGEFLVVKPISVDTKFLFYSYKNQSFVEYLDSSVESVTRSHQRVRPDLVFNTSFPLPPLSEQQQIVFYLDEKTSLIDSLIQSKQKKITLLKEKRTSLINQIVTKGLNPNVEMKDSGVEWIGEIPSHWKFQKVKKEFSFKSGGTPSTENPDFWNGSIPWVSSKDMKSKYLEKTEDYITDEGLRNSSCSIIETNSLIMVVRSGILRRTIPVSINRVEVVVNQDQKVLSPISSTNVEFFYYFVIGNETNLLLDWMKEGTTVESIELENLKNFKFPLPPLSEQQQIVEYLDRETELIDKTVSIEERKIELLKEYKQSLISEVITGKRKVVSDE